MRNVVQRVSDSSQRPVPSFQHDWSSEPEAGSWKLATQLEAGNWKLATPLEAGSWKLEALLNAHIN